MKFTRIIKGQPKKCVLDLNNIFDMEVSSFLNKSAVIQGKENSKYINELFIYFFRYYYAISQKVEYCSEYQVNGIIDTKFKMILQSINNKHGYLSCKRSKLLFHLQNIKFIFIAIINLMFVTISLFLFICINSILSSKPVLNNSIILERTQAARTKFKWYKENLNCSIIIEQLRFNNIFYSTIRLGNIFSLTYFLIINIFRDIKFLLNYSKIYLSADLFPFILYYYSKRIPHAIVYEYSLKCLLSQNVTEVYTGNNLDRFALVEEKVSKVNKVRLINVPHGIEYGFLLPHCFTGDLFYTYSKEGSIQLNKNYNTNKFKFSEEVVSRMLSRNYYSKVDKSYVFFTEPFEIEINRTIIKYLKEISLINGFKFYVKLHPRDNKTNYDDLEVNFIIDFEDSITNNICIARKSTVLLESIYNGSKSIAVLLSESDKFVFNQFPSLQDYRIIKVYDLKQLKEYL